MERMLTGLLLLSCALLLSLAAFAQDAGSVPPPPGEGKGAGWDRKALSDRAAKFATFEATLDATGLPESERRALAKLLEVGPLIDKLYWWQNSPEGDAEFLRLSRDRKAPRELLRLFRIHYGRWDRIDGDLAFFGAPGKKPAGSGFYPSDVTREELERFIQSHPDRRAELESPFTVIRRDPGGLHGVPYHQAFQPEVEALAGILDQAAALTANPWFKAYLRTRAAALRTDDYFASDVAWLDVQDSPLDAVIAPYETYDDGLLGLKAAYEGLLLLVDPQATAKLAAFRGRALDLERNLPLPDGMKKTTTGAATPIGVYAVIQASGMANAGVKSIAASLPNDERVRDQKGAKTILFSNVMQAKFEKILRPIATRLLDRRQLDGVRFDAFFEHVLLHELAHPLGQNQVWKDGKPTDLPVRAALKERYAAVEECKADVIGLYNLGFFIREKVLPPEREAQAYITQVASIFRAVRFGSGEAHGQASVIQFNFFSSRGAIRLDPKGARFHVDVDKMRTAVAELGTRLLTLEATGDYAGAGALLEELGGTPPELQAALAKLTGIPTDVELKLKVKLGKP